MNAYACAVEDALIEQVKRGQAQNILLEAAGEERAAMNIMLTNPDVLADYVNKFFGPDGPYPTMTNEERAVAEQQQARAQFEAEIAQQEQQTQVPAQFQRPQMDMPSRERAASPAGQFWGSFSQMMDNNPEDAWKFLAQAPQGALGSKLLVQDS